MIEIAKGKSGQADLRTDITPNPSCPGGYLLDEGDFIIYLVGSGMIARKDFGGYFGEAGWNVTQEGVVTVPSGAALGVYRADYCVGEGMCDLAQDTHETYFYEFEVTCLAVEIEAEEIDRDENVYRLSCTATPQGGNEPYSYVWSSGILGSSVISGQYAQTLVIEIPVGGTGTISVDVTDSSDPECEGAASFDVCELVGDFTALVKTPPPVGEVGPYVYECQATATDGQGPYTYSWQTEFGGGTGQTVELSFPDNLQYKIRLVVTDAEGCKAFVTRQIGSPSSGSFVVSTNPSGTDSGTVTGSRDSMQFNVTLIATADSVDNPPAHIFFELTRPLTSEVLIVPGYVIASSNPHQYEASWPVTTLKGRWEITVMAPYTSNTAVFKIDKREQIVLVANSWPGALKDIGHGGSFCDDLVRYIYGYVGLTIPLPPSQAPQDVKDDPQTVTGLWWGMNQAAPDSGDGAIAFYQFPADTTRWRHNGVGVGNAQIVDQNCGLSHNTTSPSTVGKHSDSAAELLAPPAGTGLYKTPSYFSTSELQSLDSE